MDSSGFHTKLPTVSSSKPSDGIGAKLTPEQIGPLRIAPFDKLKEKHKKEKETQDVIEIDDDPGMFFRFWFKLLIRMTKFFSEETHWGHLVVITNYPKKWSTEILKNCGLNIKFIDRSGSELKVLFRDRKEAFTFYDKLKSENIDNMFLHALYPSEQLH